MGAVVRGAGKASVQLPDGCVASAMLKVGKEDQWASVNVRISSDISSN
jgi:hypothetical protein